MIIFKKNNLSNNHQKYINLILKNTVDLNKVMVNLYILKILV